MTIGIESIGDSVRTWARRIGLSLVIAGVLLSASVWIQFGNDELSRLLWCVAVLPYVLGYIVVRFTPWPISASFAVLAGVVATAPEIPRLRAG